MCFLQSSSHALVGRSEHDFCSQGFQQTSALDGHGIRHSENQSVASNGSSQGQTDTCVSACWLDDDGVLVDKSFLLGIVEHHHTNAVLHAASWIQHFKFDENLGFQSQLLLNLAEFQQWSLSYQFRNVFSNLCHICISLSIISRLMILKEFKRMSPFINERMA